MRGNHSSGKLKSSGYCIPWLQWGNWHCLPKDAHREAEVWTKWAASEGY